MMWKNIELVVERENNSRITHLGNNIKYPNTALYSLLFLSYLIVFRSLESVRRLGHVVFLLAPTQYQAYSNCCYNYPHSENVDER